MLDIKDWMRTDANGKGVINILSAEKLYQMPKLYAASLLWMLSELYEQLPEAGDLEKPKLVFFFDEAHLLFNDAPQVLLDKIEQVIRLIRSKAWASGSFRKTRLIFRIMCSGSSVIAFNMLCGLLRQKIRKQ